MIDAPTEDAPADVAERAIAYPPEAILTIDQVAEWLQLNKRTIDRMDIPCFYLGQRVKRYIASDVLADLRKRTEP